MFFFNVRAYANSHLSQSFFLSKLGSKVLSKACDNDTYYFDYVMRTFAKRRICCVIALFLTV